MRVVALSLMALSIALPAAARPTYVSRIPNGAENTCVTCHNSPNGGSRDVFGNDWDDASQRWANICDADSDGDGQTNGQELGDPSCIWTSGAAARTSNISDPSDASSTSSDPDGVDASGGEGEGEGDTGTVIPSSGGSWMCPQDYLGDGECDCGCGALDSDCADDTIASCQFNDCDEWQSTQGLQVDETDPTLCVGGDLPTGATCPANSTAVTGGCACNSGFEVNAAGDGCTAASEGEGEGDASEGEGDASEGEDEGSEGEDDDDAEEAPSSLNCAASTGAAPVGLAVFALGLAGLRRRRR